MSFINPIDAFISLGRHIASNSGLSAGVDRLGKHLGSYATPQNKAIAAVAVGTVTAAVIHPVSRPAVFFLLGVTGSLSLIILNLVVLGLTAATLLIKAGKGVAKAGAGARGFREGSAAIVTQDNKPAPKSPAATSPRGSVVEVNSTALSTQADDLDHQETNSNQAPKTTLESDRNVVTTHDGTTAFSESNSSHLVLPDNVDDEPPFIPDNWDQHVEDHMPIDNQVSNDFYLPTNEDLGLSEFDEETLIPRELPGPAAQLPSPDAASDEVMEKHTQGTKPSIPLPSRATYSLREVAQIQGAKPSEAVSHTGKFRGFLDKAVRAAGGRRRVANGALVAVGVLGASYLVFEAYQKIKDIRENGLQLDLDPDAAQHVEEEDNFLL